ncbi:hypothetical protein HNY73_005438 [Argiope bruennichi]|uniref:Uncharacterized protein n=1 Tax=Argiope bruennichi TaxID=94029 RepID=A0A8T0FJ49_ARGBR|nr:hypothetical protein HNY73_005438 [Argiope bruennichi]
MLTSKHMLSLSAKCYLMAARLEPFGIMASIHHNNDYHLIANVHFWIAGAPLRSLFKDCALNTSKDRRETFEKKGFFAEKKYLFSWEESPLPNSEPIKWDIDVHLSTLSDWLRSF